MKNILRSLLFITMSLLLSSCLLPNEKGKVLLNLSSSDQAARDAGKGSDASITVSNVELVNDQIIVTGSDLSTVTKVKVSHSGTESILSIISQTTSQLILSSSSKVGLALNTLMSLTLENAYGASVVEVTFNLPDSSVSTDKIGDEQVTTAKIADGAITAVKLNQMSASVGQLLRWNGTSWAAADLDALTYAGTWDASVGGNPNPAAVGGEYYIVSANGTADPGDGDSRTWAQGDWIVFNNNTSAWDQISNSSDVTSFEGRTGGVTAQAGDYTWAMIDKTTSSIGDIADVDLSTPATTGKVLKFDGTSWVADDDLSGGGAGSVSSSEIADGSIVDADVSGSAAIAWSKINKTGAAASDVGLGNVDNIQQMPLSYLDTTATLGSDDAKIPSQNAVKTYVDNTVAASVTSITGGAGLSDGPITTTGTIDVQVDGTSLEIASDALQVKALGIGTAHLAANAVTTAKITDGNITNAKIDSVADTKITTACSDGEILSASSGNFVCASTTSAGNWTLTSDPYLYYNGGNVGIGISSPTSRLSVKGNLSTDLTGTVDVTAGSNAVTGTGTSFDTELSVGDAIKIGSEIFTISSIADATNLTIDSNHVAGASGVIAQTDTTLLSLMNGDNTNIVRVDHSGLLSLNGSLSLQESSGNDTINIRSPSSLIASYSLILPSSEGNSGEFLTTDGSGVLSWATAPAATSVSAGAGAVATPSMSFSSDSDTGFYSSGTDQVGISNNGVNTFNFTTTALTSPTTGGATLTTANGTAAAPTFSFAGDEDTGWYRAADNELAAATGGSERIRIDDSGNVGIGVSSPTEELEVDGTTKSEYLIVDRTANTEANFIEFNIGATDQYYLRGINAANALTLGTASNGSSEIIRFEAGGDIGIGTTNPDSRLHIFSASGRSFISETSNDYVAEFKSTDPNAYIVFEDSTSTNDGNSIGVTGDDMKIRTASTERMRIDSTGNVGIGTTSPTRKLHVRSDGAYQLRLENGATGGGFWNIAQSDNTFGTSGGKLLFIPDTETSTSAAVTFENSGNVGIGTTSPSEKLDIIAGNILIDNNYALASSFTADGESAFYPYRTGINSQAGLGSLMAQDGGMQLKADASISFAETDLDKVVGFMNLNTDQFIWSGSIGIGTSTPREALDVNGSITVGSEAGGDAGITYYSRGSDGSETVKIGFKNASEDDEFQFYNSGGNGFFTWYTNDSSVAEVMRLTNEGNLGLGTDSPSYTLEVAGTVAGSSAYVETSDRRYKKNFLSISNEEESALDKILKIEGIYFDWRNDEFPQKKFSRSRDMGVIAQDVQKVFPEAVVVDKKGYFSVAYSKLVAPLIESVRELFSNEKELRREVASLRENLKSIESKNKDLESQNRALEEYLCLKDSNAPFCRNN